MPITNVHVLPIHMSTTCLDACLYPFKTEAMLHVCTHICRMPTHKSDSKLWYARTVLSFLDLLDCSLLDVAQARALLSLCCWVQPEMASSIPFVDGHRHRRPKKKVMAHEDVATLSSSALRYSFSGGGAAIEGGLDAAISSYIQQHRLYSAAARSTSDQNLPTSGQERSTSGEMRSSKGTGRGSRKAAHRRLILMGGPGTGNLPIYSPRPYI